MSSEPVIKNIPPFGSTKKVFIGWYTATGFFYIDRRTGSYRPCRQWGLTKSSSYLRAFKKKSRLDDKQERTKEYYEFKDWDRPQ